MLRMGSALCEAFVRLSLAYIILLACPNSFRQIVFHAFCTFMDINMPCLYPHAGPNGMGCVPCYSSCFFFFRVPGQRSPCVCLFVCGHRTRSNRHTGCAYATSDVRDVAMQGCGRTATTIRSRTTTRGRNRR